MFFYQINPDYFAQICDQKNIVDHPYDITFYDLVLQSLDYIQDLGCDGIWLMPLFIRGYRNEKGLGSPYSVREFNLDLRYGTEDQLKTLVKNVHDKNMKIITEYIPNHMAPSSSFLNENKYRAYCDNAGNFLHDSDWGDTAKLNYQNPETVDFTKNNLIRLMSDYGFDGFRLDMAHYLYYDPSLHPVHATNNEDIWHAILYGTPMQSAVLFGEVYNDRSNENDGYHDALRLIENGINAYDKGTHELIKRKLVDKNLDITSEFEKEISKQKSFAYLRFATNHDDAPGIYNFKGVDQYVLALQILALMPGYSMVYAGDEYGLMLKPSVTGKNIIVDGVLKESDEIYLLPTDIQNYIYTTIKNILRVRKNIIECSHIRFIHVQDDKNNNINDLLTFMYDVDNNKKILVCANFCNNHETLSGKINLKEFGFTNNYHVYDLLNSADMDSYNIEELLWINIDSLKIKILQITQG